MIEYELSVSIQVENETSLENMLITVESIEQESINLCATELISINLSDVASKKSLSRSKDLTQKYEIDSWLSPL